MRANILDLKLSLHKHSSLESEIRTTRRAHKGPIKIIRVENELASRCSIGEEVDHNPQISQATLP